MVALAGTADCRVHLFLGGPRDHPGQDLGHGVTNDPQGVDDVQKLGVRRLRLS